MLRFLRNYVRSMRLYYAFVTGTSVLTGIMMVRPWGLGWRDAAFAAIGFLAWGVNQIFSDWWDRKEDAVNAPHRPMVTGELAAKPALALSAALMALFAVVAWAVSPWALAFLAAGGSLNLLYSKTKGVVLLGNAIYATSITMCVLFGMSVRGGEVLESEMRFLGTWICLAWSWYAHFLMCYFSAFKDVEGDRAAGLKTAPVRWGEERARRVGEFLQAPALAVGVVPLAMMVWARSWSEVMALALLFLVSAQMWWLAFWLRRMVRWRRWHDVTRLNCESCVWMHTLLLWGWADPLGGLLYFLTAWFSIEVLFRSVYCDGQE